MRQPYSREFHPPAPALSVELRAPGASESRRVLGKIDTGADICALPASAVAALDLPPSRVVRAAGSAGDLADAVVYRVALRVAGITFPDVEALATRRDYAIIGRNVLAGVVLRLDGPRAVLSVTKPPKRRVR